MAQGSQSFLNLSSCMATLNESVFWKEEINIQRFFAIFFKSSFFAGGTKMADVQTPFCAWLLRFSGCSIPRVQSEAESGGSHICRHLWVHQHLRNRSQSTQGLPAQIFGNNGNKFLAWKQTALSPPLLLLAITCQEASELFVGLLAICVRTFRMPPITHYLPLIFCDDLKKKRTLK